MVSFVPFGTFIDSAFWSEINKRKVDEWRLDEEAKSIKALFSIYDSVGSECRLSFGHESFDANSVGVEGELTVFNTIEAFKKLDKASFLAESGNKVLSSIRSGAWLTNPGQLTTFSLLIYADVKKYQYYYWNCFPAVVDFPQQLSYKGHERVTQSSSLIKYAGDTKELVFCVSHCGKCSPISELVQVQKSDDVLIAYLDCSPVEGVAGWMLRNLVAAVSVAKSNWTEARFLSVRGDHTELFHLQWTNNEFRNAQVTAGDVTFTGWEANEKGLPRPRFVDMKKQFDPTILMEQAVGLNLSLIKWRLVPEMKLERFAELKVLIFGAGTLGCNLGRNLMAYNVRQITFIDNSTVSYSNPVRQSLSTFKDAIKGTGKAETAAAALKEIYPSVDARAVNLTVPMPGHTVADETKLAEDVKMLETLVAEHDVMFLALDSREARWFPTVLANKFDKMSYSVALGFDTYVIIRHGLATRQTAHAEDTIEQDAERPTTSTQSVGLNEVVPYSELACYFCSDVTAPGNSMVDRTLDQQCTVSRPGLSPIAAGVATELLASVLQTPDPRRAGAGLTELDENSSLLGTTPHQIRGFVSRFQQMTACVRRFDRCVACGSAVAECYKRGGWTFVRDVLNSPSLLERVSGLDVLQESVNDIMIDFDDDSDSLTSM